ncbi:MAG TPA: hypothetical protein ENK57_02970 [Polyangiaceae bacterium]|nr:hypothetical protein [Polyangiaceae bacterium]
MKLLRLHLEHCRDLPDGDYTFAKPDGSPHERVVITGPSASGKTTILQAIAMVKECVAGYGPQHDPRAFLRAGEGTGIARLTLLLDEAERQRADTREPVVTLEVRLSGGLGEPPPPGVRKLLSRYRHDPDVSLVDYLPDDRELPVVPFELATPTERDEARLRLSARPRKYEGVAAWLREALLLEASRAAAELREQGIALAPPTGGPPLDAFRDDLATLCPWLRLTGLDHDGRHLVFERRNGSRPTLATLSAAERDAVLLAANRPRLGLRRSIVLFDRPDLHAHPGDQGRWLDVLVQGDNQLIIASSSPAILEAVSPDQVITLG